jgi:excisionase family DNA binding protein
MPASQVLPKPDRAPGFMRFGLSAREAADAIGVSPNTFLKMVDDGRMPRPRCIGSRNVWDVDEVYSCFKSLPHDQQNEDEADTWADLKG